MYENYRNFLIKIDRETIKNKRFCVLIFIFLFFAEKTAESPFVGASIYLFFFFFLLPLWSFFTASFLHALYLALMMIYPNLFKIGETVFIFYVLSTFMLVCVLGMFDIENIDIQIALNKKGYEIGLRGSGMLKKSLNRCSRKLVFKQELATIPGFKNDFEMLSHILSVYPNRPPMWQ